MMPPPSKTAVEPEVAAVELPVPEDAPVIEPPAPEKVPIVEFAVTDGVPVVELDEPKDACGSEPPKPEHDAVLPDNAAAAGPTGETPDVVGLMPREPSSVAPRPIPVGATGAPAPMPSGEVMPRGEGAGAPPTPCANAELQPKRAVAIVAISKRVIAYCSSDGFAALSQSFGDKSSA